MARRIALRTLLGAIPAAVVGRFTARNGVTMAGALAATAAAVSIESARSVPIVGSAAALIAVGERSAPVLPRRLGETVRSIDTTDAGLGVVVGAGAVAASLAVWPHRVEAPARGMSVTVPRPIAPRPDGTGLTVVVNPASGSGRSGDVADEVRTLLPGARVREIDDGDDLIEVLQRAAGDPVTDVLGIIGGDGSVNAAAGVALEVDLPLVVFPGGTLNHFARDLGLDEVADTVEAVRAGAAVAIDVGSIGDRIFLNNASIGSYSTLVDERERLEDRLGKWPAMMVALVRVLRRGEDFAISVDGRDRQVWMVFFGNGAYEPAGFAPADRPDLVDGLLDVRVLDAGCRFSRVRLIAALATGTLARSPVYDRSLAARVSVCSETDSTRLAADGETFDGPASFVVSKRPTCLVVYAAADPDAAADPEDDADPGDDAGRGADPSADTGRRLADRPRWVGDESTGPD